MQRRICLYCFVREHIEMFCKNIDLKELFKFMKKEVNIYILDTPTESQSETVYKIIKHFQINGPIFIKDCDNYYKYTVTNDNSLCYVIVNNENKISKIHNKSFIEFNNLCQLTNICEKKIISQNICVGGYSFSNSQDFLEIYDEIKH